MTIDIFFIPKRMEQNPEAMAMLNASYSVYGKKRLQLSVFPSIHFDPNTFLKGSNHRRMTGT